jgi:hypothetical protein
MVGTLHQSGNHCMGEFDVKNFLLEEIEFCQKMQMRITKIRLGTSAFANLCSYGYPLKKETVLLVFGIPCEVVGHGNPWAVGFEREQIQKS